MKLKLDLLKQGINLQLYNNPINAISSRVTACNGLFLSYQSGEKLYTVKARKNPNSRIYLVSRDKKTLLIDKNGSVLSEIDILQSVIDSDIFSEQLSGIIAASLYGCQLVNVGQQCKFCSSTSYSGPKFSPEEFKSELRRVREIKPFSALTLNGGSLITRPFRGYDFMRDYVVIAKDLGIQEVNLELMPSTDLSYGQIIGLLNLMQTDGVTSTQFNIEVWDRQKRVELMPYKGKIPVETYLK